MIKVQEKDLEKILDNFNGRNVIIEFEGVITGKLRMKQLKVKYERNKGNIKLFDMVYLNNIKIDTTSMYKVEIDESVTNLIIRLDYDEKIKINKL